MMATFAIEIVLMIWVLVRDRTSVISRLSALILFFLAMFQISEYSLCEQMGFDQSVWARVGFVSITALPVLGIHLIHVIAVIKRRAMVWVAYASAVIWFILFAAYDIFVSYGCAANYAIFDLQNGFGGAYFTYYYVWLFVGIGLALYWAGKVGQQKTRKALQALAGGYFLFIAPTTVINLVNSQTAEAIPSIMCGFAVLFALVLAFVVLPNSLAKSE